MSTPDLCPDCSRPRGGTCSCLWNQGEPTITCPRCGMTSANPDDVRQGYCGNCHDWTSAETVQRPATPEGWVPVPPNTLMAAARALHTAARHYRSAHGWTLADLAAEAEMLDELGDRLDRALGRAAITTTQAWAARLAAEAALDDAGPEDEQPQEV